MPAGSSTWRGDQLRCETWSGVWATLVSLLGWPMGAGNEEPGVISVRC